jgi:phage shock protein A
MGIFTRLSALIRSNLNDAIARAEDPEKMLNQIIIDMREQLTKAKQEVAVAIADERRLKVQVDEEFRQAGEWERRAMLAVKQGRDDLARQALLRQQEYAERAQSLHDTWQRHAQDTDRLKDALRQLNTKIEEARRKKNLLIAKQKRAQAQQRIHETMSGLSDRSAFESFDRMADRIEESERRALAAAEVTEELSGDPLEREFAQLDKGGDADFRLLELKQKMGILPAPAEGKQLAGGESKRLGAGSAAPAGQVHDAELLAEFEALEEEERGTA